MLVYVYDRKTGKLSVENREPWRRAYTLAKYPFKWCWILGFAWLGLLLLFFYHNNAPEQVGPPLVTLFAVTLPLIASIGAIGANFSVGVKTEKQEKSVPGACVGIGFEQRYQYDHANLFLTDDSVIIWFGQGFNVLKPCFMYIRGGKQRELCNALDATIDTKQLSSDLFKVLGKQYPCNFMDSSEYKGTKKNLAEIKAVIERYFPYG